MAGAVVPPVVILGIPGQELAHDAGNALSAALKEDVRMVVHQDPCIDRAFPVNDVLTKTFEEQLFVLSVLKYVRFIYTPHHDMVQGAGDI